MIHILTVEDKASIRDNLIDLLKTEGYKAKGVGTITEAKKEIKKRFYNIVLLDLNLPDGMGLELLNFIRSSSENTLSIIVTGVASLESAIVSLNEGAFAYVQKPLNFDELKIHIKKALAVQKLSVDNKSLLHRLRELSLKDTQTELYNYRYLMERLKSELKRAKRYVLPLSVIMADIDYFKSINDVYGHEYGNVILKDFAKCLMKFVRGNDIVVRYGGEEFVILLPDTNKEGALFFGERLLEMIKKQIFDPQGKRIKLKVSMGLSSFPEDSSASDSPSGIINLADKALLHAKETGGNRLCASKGPSHEAAKNMRKSENDAVAKLRGKLSKMVTRSNQTLIESIYAFAKTMEVKDYYTGKAIENMVRVVVEIGKRLGLSDKIIEDLKHAAALHDIGKIGIPAGILHKKKKLTKEEFTAIKKHPEIGAQIIEPIHFLGDLLPIILYHHERYDGMGYSAGLKGKQIPLGARIIAVADVYQALISVRPYRRAYSKKEAMDIIKKGAGTQFDPDIVKVFLEIMGKKT